MKTIECIDFNYRLILIYQEAETFLMYQLEIYFVGLWKKLKKNIMKFKTHELGYSKLTSKWPFNQLKSKIKLA